MKSLIILVVLVSSSAMADCSLTLKVKNEKSKSARLNGVNIGAKQIEALKTACNVKTIEMTDDEKVEDFKVLLAKKKAKKLAEK
jgi:hypothetical protein